MDLTRAFPAHCRRNIRKLTSMLCTDAETAFAMMLMTAALMDLDPGDDKVAELILIDCNVEVGA